MFLQITMAQPKPFDVNDKKHARYGNDPRTRLVIIAKNPEAKKVQMQKSLSEQFQLSDDKITWIPENYSETKEWAKILRDRAATNVLIDTDGGDTDSKVYQHLKDALLIGMLENPNWIKVNHQHQSYLIQNPQWNNSINNNVYIKNLQWNNHISDVQKVLLNHTTNQLEFNPIWDENLHANGIQEWIKHPQWTERWIKNPVYVDQWM